MKTDMTSHQINAWLDKLEQARLGRESADIAPLDAEFQAFVKAASWESASHSVKAGAGRRAKERIVAGDDAEKAIADMEQEWQDYCRSHAGE